MRYNFIASMIAVLLLGTGVSYAQYTSNSVTGGYHEAGSWSGSQPPANGTLNNSIRISTGAEITRSDQGGGNSIDARGSDLWGYSAIVEGKFIVEGSFTNDNGGILRVFNGGTLEIFGDLTADEEVIVDNGGTLIVHGNLYLEDAGWGYQHELHGTVVVGGDAQIADFVFNNTGMLVVGGDLTLDGNAWTRIVTGTDVYVDGTVTDNNGSGTFDDTNDEGDFTDLENEQGSNDVLNDILEDIGLVSSVDEPTSFTYTNLTTNTVDLSWTLNASNDDVMITIATSDLSIVPVDGTTYAEGNSLGGATVIYNGSATSLAGTNITAGVDNYLTIWSVNGSLEYSKAVKLSIEMLSAATIFYEDFESGNANSWTLGSLSGDHQWVIGSAEAYLGSNSAYVSEDNGVSATYDETGNGWVGLEKSVAIPSGYKSAELTFYWKCVGEAGYDRGEIYENNTLISDALVSQETWVEEVIDITSYINSTFDLGVWFYCDWASGVDPGLCIDEIRITGSEVARPVSFAGTAVSSDQVDLLWTKSTDNDDVIIAYSSFGAVGRPESGVSYSVGDYLQGGGKVVYIGSANSYSHTGNFSGKLNYTIWSVNANAYSSAITEEVSIPVDLPYTEDFESDVDEWNFSAVSYNNWVNGSADSQSGSKSAYISYDKGVTAAYDNSQWTNTDLTISVDLRGFETAGLTFWWKADGRQDRAYGECYLDGSRISSSQEYRDADTQWNQETIDLSSYTGNISELTFKWYNNTTGAEQNPGLCIDNISITGTIADPASFSATNLNDLYNTLDWTKNAYGDDVIIAVSESGSIGDLEEGTEYTVGDVLAGGGTIIYIGDLETYQHEPLKYSTTYSYKIWSARNGTYSSGTERNAGTPDKVTLLTEYWEDGDYSEWTRTSSHATNTIWWLGGSQMFSQGSQGAYITTSTTGVNTRYDRNDTRNAELKVDISLENMQSATLTFDWRCQGEAGRDYGEVWFNNVRVSGVAEYQGDDGTWQSAVIDLTSFCGTVGDQTLEFRWVNDDNNTRNTPGFSIDNIEIGGIYTATSTVSQGSSSPASISSLLDTSTEALQVFEFTLEDNNSQNGLLLPPEERTLIQQLVISKGTANNIADWSDAIAGAMLFGPDVDVNGLAGTVTSSAITFNTSGTNIIIDNTASETYQLKIWLQSDLNGAGINDGDVFDFKLDNNEIVTGWGDDFVVDQSIESGAVTIEIVATELQFAQQPSSNATVNTVLGQIVKVAATDENGNVDIGFGTAISLTNDGSGGSIAMNNASASPVSGTASFSNLTFGSTGTVTLSAASGSLVSGDSDPVTITNYCQPTHTSTNRYIANVIINTLDNSSGDDGGYVEYLDQETTFAKGETYDITIGGYNASGSGYAWVWVDWNQDEDFLDSGERFTIGNTNSTGIVVISGTDVIDVPNDAVTGTTRMRVQFTGESNPGNPCGSGTGESEDYIVFVTSDGWLGASPLWELPQNWSTGNVPDGTTDIFIPEHPYHGDTYPIISGDANMNNLEVASNATLTIQAGSAVTIDGDVINNGTVLVENTNDQPSSIITNGTVTGNISFKWTYDNLRWWFVGHGISNPTTSSYEAIRNVQLNDYAMYDYQDGGSFYKVSSNVGTYDLAGQNELKGYLLKVKDTGAEVSHTGTPNNDASYSRALQSEWQVMANPYPSYYQLPTDPSGTGDFANTAGTIYVTVSTSNADKTFETYNISSGISSPAAFKGILAPSQAFYIKTDAGKAGTDVTMQASNRIQDINKASLKSVISSNENEIRVKLINEIEVTDEAVIALREGETSAFTRMDSEQRFETNNLSYIYSIIDGYKAVINVLPESSDDFTQDLGVRTQEGKHLIYIDGIESISDDYEIHLEDKQAGVLKQMTDKTEYEFTSKEGADDERFVLHFKTKEVDVPTDIEDVNKDSDEAVKIYIQNESLLKVTCKWQTNRKEIDIYTVTGVKVLNKEFEGEEFNHDLKVKPGIYIVKISGANNTFEQKIFVK